MSEPVDVLVVLGVEISYAEDALARCETIGAYLRLAELRKTHAAVANIIAERDALHWALAHYAKRNPHQLQAAKVCEGVIALAVAHIGGAT